MAEGETRVKVRQSELVRKREKTEKSPCVQECRGILEKGKQRKE